MGVLTIPQPWTSLTLTGIKNVGSRSWRTTYRGNLPVMPGRVDWVRLHCHGHRLDESWCPDREHHLVDCIETKE